ncbi:MAG: HAD family phosphatase [Tissierellia bacterium]|nr:HAD family phosphatase [Tissierellia bacterium]
MNKIIFDMDGTLIDSMGQWISLIADYMESLKIKAEPQFMDDLKPKTLNESIVAIHERYNINRSLEEGVDFMHGLMRKAYLHDFDLKPGVRKGLERLKSMGMDMMVATATPDDLAHVALEAQGIDHYFQHVQTCKNSGFNKSDPRYWEMAMDKIGGKKENVAIFEDALYCVETVRSMDLYTICIEDMTAISDEKRLRQLSNQYVKRYDDIDYSVFNPSSGV